MIVTYSWITNFSYGYDIEQAGQLDVDIWKLSISLYVRNDDIHALQIYGNMFVLQILVFKS